jgi:hypothetical protein
VTQTNNSQSLALELSSSKHGLVFFDTFPRQTFLAEFLHMINAINNPATTEQHAANDEFLDSVGVSTGRVEHRNTQFRAASDGHVVGAGTASKRYSQGKQRKKLLENPSLMHSNTSSSSAS